MKGHGERGPQKKPDKMGVNFVPAAGGLPVFQRLLLQFCPSPPSVATNIASVQAGKTTLPTREHSPHPQCQRDPISAWSQSPIDPLTSHLAASAASFVPDLSPFPSTSVKGPPEVSTLTSPTPPHTPPTSSQSVRCSGEAVQSDETVPSPGSHREVDCLMLWKLTREGDVGMDMAWVIRARMECCSCHRWKRFLTAERTCQTGDRSVSGC